MIIRIEFANRTTPRFKFLLRLCKTVPTYKLVESDGLAIHSLEFTSKERKSFEAIYKQLYGLSCVAFFLNGVLTSQGEIFSQIRAMDRKSRMDQWVSRQQEKERVRAYLHPNPTKAFMDNLKLHGLAGNQN